MAWTEDNVKVNGKMFLKIKWLKKNLR